MTPEETELLQQLANDVSELTFQHAPSERDADYKCAFCGMRPKKIRAYHGSTVPISKFDRRFSAQGVFWFSEDMDKILRGESGAVSSKYLMEVILTVRKTAGWDEYEKLVLAQIKAMGYDSIKLDDNWVIFDPKNIKIIDQVRT
jgi:hypothetical protein